jgi:hypothetical protein
MGHYVAARFRFEGAGQFPQVLRPLFAGGFFTPAALGAIDFQSAGDHWFLAGYALEDFAGRFLGRRPRPPASVVLAASGDAEAQEYQRAMARQVRERSSPEGSLSPFESDDRELGVSFLAPVALAPAVLDELAAWRPESPQRQAYLYGSVDVAVAQPEELPFSHCFRHVVRSTSVARAVGSPLVLVQAEAPPRSPDTTEVLLSSSSPVLLRETQALGGRVDAASADRNLAGLAGLARALAAGGAKLLSAELTLEGGTFERERERLTAAFTGIAAPVTA